MLSPRRGALPPAARTPGLHWPRELGRQAWPTTGGKVTSSGQLASTPPACLCQCPGHVTRAWAPIGPWPGRLRCYWPGPALLPHCALSTAHLNIAPASLRPGRPQLSTISCLVSAPSSPSCPAKMLHPPPALQAWGGHSQAPALPAPPAIIIAPHFLPLICQPSRSSKTVECPVVHRSIAPPPARESPVIGLQGRQVPWGGLRGPR